MYDAVLTVAYGIHNVLEKHPEATFACVSDSLGDS